MRKFKIRSEADKVSADQSQKKGSKWFLTEVPEFCVGKNLGTSGGGSGTVSI
jgi:hypothetical protein